MEYAAIFAGISVLGVIAVCKIIKIRKGKKIKCQYNCRNCPYSCNCKYENNNGSKDSAHSKVK